MLLFDVGAVLFCTAFMLCIWSFFIPKDIGRAIRRFCGVLANIGGLIMLIAYYIVAGNTSVFTNVIQ